MDRHLKYWLLMGLYSSVLLAMPITVLANTNTQNSTDLPQIVSWDDGHGYLESGEMLRNGWGYDTVNPAGKYVLFDEEGAILRRSESMEAGLEDNYTGTEQVPAVIAFRAQVFDGFAGTIEAILEEQNGVTQTVFLNADNFYEWNLSTGSEGFDKDMQLIYFCHELDMRHLCRIKQEIGWKQKGTIICLDYQANVLRAYFGEGVRVRELNTDKIMEYLTKGRDE